jgi:6-pyruvoyltetrahydropterin/6-carboxytetrahydropterin synthase
MITIERKYHFYAAHRNELLNDKCRNIHGHTYYVTVELAFAEVDSKSGVTILFSEIDTRIEPIIKQLDHCFLIHIEDPLLKYLTLYEKECKDDLKMMGFIYPTSVENISGWIWGQIYKLSLPGVVNLKVSVQETTSAIVHYEPRAAD